jgi:hypothetical protein
MIKKKISTIFTLLTLLSVCSISAEEHLRVFGRISEFGGPRDKGVGPREGVALIQNKRDTKRLFCHGLFLSSQPKGTTGLARRLNPNARYIAMRWDYSKFPPSKLAHMWVRVSANGITVLARPIDYGPARWTKRVADVSPRIMRDLNIDTDEKATFTLIDEDFIVGDPSPMAAVSGYS